MESQGSDRLFQAMLFKPQLHRLVGGDDIVGVAQAVQFLGYG